MRQTSIRQTIPRTAFILAIAILLTCFASLSSAEDKTFSVAYNENWPPFSYRDENNKMTGILVDIINEVFETKLNMPIAVYGYPWKRVQHNVEIGVNDALVTAATKKRLLYSVRSSEIVYTLEEKAFISKTSKHRDSLSTLSLDNISRLKNYKVCDMIGNGWADTFYARHGIEIKRFKDINICFRNIAYERFDIAIHVSAAGLSQLRSEFLTDEVEMLPVIFDEVPFPLLVSKKSPHLDILPKFDEAIRAFKAEGRVQQIVDRYTK
ncbi:substrate-binding periplasmic protein [Alkalimarinus alittae]|uniref:Transporter substrate-binding domain-containing protein n=1 Tax=Alkalimarinus alittae TaxID=2961619 RepID=A0ABY6N4J1_9ALTE|nr:transporter substrate-binding domain-containing protein [Alkalimarinus alittae]UZE97040.1 transporter substrate-binding domain-containing protein [Alkalimarinus alittae]